MSSPHYFTSDPQHGHQRRRIRVHLAGEDTEVSTSSGIFSSDGIDKGTRVLLDEAPTPPAMGEFLDIGCGWGPLALSMGLLSPQANVLAVDVNSSARDLCSENAVHLGLDRVEVADPSTVGADRTFDLIWSNPPIRIGKPALHALLTRWLPQLNPGGEAWLVVHKHLGADSLAPWISTMLQQHPGSFRVDRAATHKGFRIITIIRQS